MFVGNNYNNNKKTQTTNLKYIYIFLIRNDTTREKKNRDKYIRFTSILYTVYSVVVFYIHT